MQDRVVIIAEAGVNHNGDLELAKKLVEAAAEAGADYVKFQTFKADAIVSKAARKAAYQVKNINDGDDSQYAMLKKLEMPEEWHHILIDHARKNGIAFFSTAFDEKCVDFLESLNLPLYKVPSGEITNKPYLEHIASKHKPVILSTGMAMLEEIQQAIDVMVSKGLDRSKLTVLHCNTEYPTPMKDVNLLAMEHIRKALNVSVGYSDHTQGIEVPIAAVALGAKVIEKHFTLDRTLPGPDHRASLEPDELKAMVTAIRNIESAISGSGMKTPSESELRNRPVIRKSLHYSVDIAKGATLERSSVIALRPGDGISPFAIDTYVGRKLNRSVNAFDKLSESDFL
jgi:N,N'-diacetyllegionaminate synthase